MSAHLPHAAAGGSGGPRESAGAVSAPEAHQKSAGRLAPRPAAGGFAEREEAPAEALTNAMADLWEQQTRLLLDNGGEALVRTRLARLLPAPAVATALVPDADLHLRAVTGAKVLTDLAKARRSPAGAGQLKAIAATLAECAKRTKGASDV